jgi:integrase
LVADLSPESRSGLLLALLAGLRDQEVYRVEGQHYSQAEGLLRIPAEIRKTSIGNVVPVVGTLEQGLTHQLSRMRADTIIPLSQSVVRLELRNATKGWDHPWSGFQPARRALVTWAEDSGFTQDTIALVTGHSRTDVVSRYSAEYGRIELKRAVIESVERRLNA